MISRTLKRIRQNWHLNTTMMLAMLALIIVGVFFIYSACYISPDADIRPLYRRQLIWSFAGLIAFALFSAIDYRRLCEMSWGLFIASCVMLVAVLIFGDERSGARRWFDLGFISLQPSEFAKVSSILLLAWRLGRTQEEVRSPMALLTNAGLMIIPWVLISVEPDLGTAMVFVPTVGAVLYVSGVAPRILGVLTLIVAIVGISILSAFALPEKFGAGEETQERFRKATLLLPHQRERIAVFLKPERDPLGMGWNVRQSEIAVGSGGLTGKGFCRGTQNVLGFLPYSVAPTDFIYCVIAEETGFVGSTTVIVLFGVLLLSGLITAIQSRDRMGRLLCVGVVSMVFFHVFINIAMTIGLMPITGLPLPLLSYGGSFTVTIMAALGIVQSVSVYGRKRDRGYSE